MAFRTHHLNVAGAQVKARPPLHGTQKTSVLAEIGNKLRSHNVEEDARRPLKPTNVSNVIRKPLKGVENEVVRLTETLKCVAINDADPPPVEEKKVVNKEQTSYSSTLYNIQDIDKESANDVLFIGEYAKDIFEYLRALEIKYPLRPNFLCGTVTPRMRLVLVDWLFDVQLQFSLLSETMFLSVAIIDRYLQKVHIIDKKKIQLLGAASMLTASKYEETYPPEISNFVYICSNLYTKNEILKMENQILRTLDFFIGYPLSVHFLRRYSKACSPDEVTYTLAKYFQEMCLMEYELCYLAPSRLAAAALYLALRLRSKTDTSSVWSETLIYYSQYKLKDIADIAKKIAFAVMNIESSKYQALYQKYSRSKYLKVSTLPEVSPVNLKRMTKLL
ncbi:G2/mitotic-specific cyclin-B-like [Schistocerca americana]|uniref:G2/mitotic-specific cyclin-B-like n=1 Tax=Schistocerca americana TaxID=7009 RepID=UPI001F4F9D02|nr:G2/mitotic-specific cyclin-B-like [Schistocerca americana]XP_047118744.1 G2/mitotic-specific cyclin-B-like [Schistocerca piceifrons]XP_049964776.1 G2/mitotic-specific cyclin-B-like [Schistocerca serialis cubense]